MIQVSPESGNGSWRYCSGFNIEDDSIMGFSQNHLNGTGCPDLGDILILPFCGDIQNEKYKSRYEKEYQKALEKYTLLLDKATPREAKTVNLLLCELYIKWAVDMSEQNKFDESFEYLKNATQYNTLNPEIYYNVAKNNYKKKDFTACVEAINKALEYDKQNEYKSKYLLMLSEAHHQLGNFFEEKKALTDLLKYDDKNPEGLYRVGLMYTAQHDIKNAEDAFKRAILYNPELIQAKYNLALLYESNNRDKAKELYMEVLEQDPTFEEAKNALADLSTSDFF